MRRGDTLLLEVEALAFGGDSLGHAPDGRVVFFAGGAPGDRVTVVLDEVKARFARATLERVLSPGPSRVEPRCPLSGRCGGCAWQEVSLEVQRAAKQQVVARALGRLGATVADVVAATAPFGQRSRAKLSRGATSLGFQARRTHDVIDVPTCPLLEPALDEALALARRHLLPLLPPGATVSGLVGRGGKSQIAVEGMPVTAAMNARPALEALAAEESVAGVICGSERFGDPLLDTSSDGEAPFWSAADGFAQASHQGNRALRAHVAAEARRLLDGVARPRLLELYAGDGNFSRDLASLVGEAPFAGGELLVEEADREACARLARNVPGPPRPRLVALPAAEAVRRLAGGDERFDLVLLDPPRAGAADVVPHLAALTSRVLYVSCDPMTLARDAATLAAAGLVPERATPFDLMPHTSHVETVCSFRRRSD